MPMSTKALTNIFPGDPLDSIELGRFILLDHVESNAESWFFTRCKELLKKEGLRGIVAFSDDTKRTTLKGESVFIGHKGIVYQSCGASYFSRSSPRIHRLLPDGTIFSPRAISKIRAHERGWKYAAEILVKAGATKPQENEDLAHWIQRWLPITTRPLHHSGNHRFAFALHRSIVPVGTPLPYPKNFTTAKEMEIQRKKRAPLAAHKSGPGNGLLIART
jgi:hypothetical protein